MDDNLTFDDLVPGAKRPQRGIFDDLVPGNTPPDPNAAAGVPQTGKEGAPQKGFLERAFKEPVEGPISVGGFTPSIINPVREVAEGAASVGSVMKPMTASNDPTQENYDPAAYYDELKKRTEDEQSIADRLKWLPGMIASTWFRHPTAPSKPGSGPIRDTMRLATESGRETRAGQVLERSATDPEAAQRALAGGGEELVPGSKPTTFQATGDMGLGLLERAVAAKNPAEFQTVRGEQNSARIKALESTRTNGDPEAVAESFRAALRGATREADEAVRTAEFTAWQRAQELGGQHDPQIYGNVFRHELQMAEQTAREAEGQLWRAIDPNGTLVAGTTPVRDVRNNIYGNLTQAEQAGLTDGERAVLGVIDNYGPAVPFRELSTLRGLVSSQMRQELSTNGRTPAYGRLVQLRTGLEDAITNRVLDTATGEFTTEAAARLGAASAATRQRATTFNATPIRDIMRREGLEGPYKLQEGAVAGRIFTPGPKGYDNVMALRRAVGDREIIPVLQDSAVASMRRTALNSDGTINPQRLRSWLEKHQDALRAIDEARGFTTSGGGFTQRLRNAGEAAQSMADVAARRQMILDEHQRGVFGRLIGVADKEDVTRIVGSIFGGAQRLSNARALARRVSGDPEAMDGARRAIVDHIMEKFVSNTEGATSGQNLIRADQFQTFIRQNRASLEQFFPPETVNMWTKIAEDIHRANRSISAVKLPGGSNTMQDYMALKTTGVKPTTMTKVFTYLGAGAAGTFLSNPLVGLGAAAAAAPLIYLRDAGIRSVQDLVKQAMLNPQLARELLRKASSTEGRASLPPGVRAALGKISMFAGVGG